MFEQLQGSRAGVRLGVPGRWMRDGAPTILDVVPIDEHGVAESWCARQGYTNVVLPLGTPPEKDVGFPYAHSWGNASAAVTAAMARYSWQST
jgi:hypothetical protein